MFRKPNLFLLRLLVSLVLVQALAPVVSAQFADFNELAGHVADKLKRAKPRTVVVADFVVTDGSAPRLGAAFASLFASSVELHSKKLPIAKRDKFTALIESEKLSPANLASGEVLQALAKKFPFDYIILGTVSTEATNYKLDVSVLHVPDASTLLTSSTLLQRSELIDSLAQPFPPNTDYPVVRLPDPPGPDVSRMPKCLSCPSPAYTVVARQQKVQGTDTFEVLVSPTGAIVAVHPLKLLGYGLDEEAFRPLKSWRLKPGTDPRGTPIGMIVPVLVTFRMF